MGTGVVQFGRVATLTLYQTNILVSLAGHGTDFSNFRFRFQITANDIETPNTAVIRIYNVSKGTQLNCLEYNRVLLTAGYQGNVGQIFHGTIKQFRYGKERNTDSFLEIYAADGDLAYNFGLVNVTIKEGITPEQQLNASVAGFQAVDPSITVDPNAAFYLTEHNVPNARGKVLFGLARDYMRDLSDTNNVRWSIQNGVVTLVPITGYLPSEAVKINSQTGMIGSPEATEEGIIVECLLNPAIKVGTAIQLNNNDITTTQIKEQFFPGYTDTNFVAKVDSTAPDGLYRVIVMEHRGDTRDTEWNTKLTCLLIDQSAPAADSVAPYGLPPSN